MKNLRHTGKETITHHLVVWLTLFGLITAAVMTSAWAPAYAFYAEQITYYHFDALGSPVAASDEAGNLVWKETYQPYGERIQNDPAAGSNTRWYTGHPHDNDTGLTYMGARYYDPIVGRFMAADPKGFNEANPHSFNRYAYANNNPYKYIDPDGEFAILPWIIWGVATGAFLNDVFNPEPAVLDQFGDAPLGTVDTYPGPIKFGKQAATVGDLAQKATKGTSGSVQEMADELADRIGKNSVKFKSPGKSGRIDLRGKAHFDKKTQTRIDTPHVQTRDLKIGPNGQVSAPKKTEITRSATKQDVRTARELARRQGLLK